MQTEQPPIWIKLIMIIGKTETRWNGTLSSVFSVEFTYCNLFTFFIILKCLCQYFQFSIYNIKHITYIINYFLC